MLCRFQNSNACKGGVLLIFTMDHAQIQPVEGRSVSTSSHVIPCFNMVALNDSVQAINNTNFKHIQKIARFHCSKFKENEDLLDEFTDLCSSIFTFFRRGMIQELLQQPFFCIVGERLQNRLLISLSQEFVTK